MKTLKLTNSEVPVQLDDDDWEWASITSWYALARGFIVRNIPKKDGNGHTLQYLGREIITRNGLEPKLKNGKKWVVQYVDGNKSNLRKENLRAHSHNIMSHKRRLPRRVFKDLYTGVSPTFYNYRNKEGRKFTRYTAFINIDGVHTYLGCYEDPVKAAKAVDRVAFKHFGVNARLNFPEDYARKMERLRAQEKKELEQKLKDKRRREREVKESLFPRSINRI